MKPKKTKGKTKKKRKSKQILKEMLMDLSRVRKRTHQQKEMILVCQS